jgi:hypothetical protein
MIVLALAVARVTRLMMYEHGPKAILWHIRNRIGAHAETVPAGSWAELWNCRWCLSFWVSIVIVLCFWWSRTVTITVCLVLAINVMAAIIVKWTEDAM